MCSSVARMKHTQIYMRQCVNLSVKKQNASSDERRMKRARDERGLTGRRDARETARGGGRKGREGGGRGSVERFVPSVN